MRVAKRPSMAREFWLYLRRNRAYWMVPILLVLILLIVVGVLGSTGAAPFIYTLF